MPMESQVKFRTPQNISWASQQISIAARRWERKNKSENGSIQLVQSNSSHQKPRDATLILKYKNFTRLSKGLSLKLDEWSI